MNELKRCDECSTIHGPYWPIEASKWINRRKKDVPSKSVIKEGCIVWM